MRYKFVLVTGVALALMVCVSPVVLASPGSGTWRLFKHGDVHRYGEVVLPLRDGRVLVTSGGAIGGRGALVSTTEIFDPRSGTWMTAADIPVPGTQQSAVELPDGSVLIAGGAGAAHDLKTAPPVLADAEVFSPLTLTWAVVGKLAYGRMAAGMVVLPKSRAMIVGGRAGSGQALASVELFDPATRAWSAGPSLSSARSEPIALVLGDGRALVMGGYGPISGDEVAILQPLYDETGRQVGQGPILTNELYDPATNQWHGYQISFPSQLGQQVVMSAFALPGGRVIGLSTNLLAAAGLGLQPGVRKDGYPFLLDPSSAAITIGSAAPQDSGLRATGVLPDGLLVLANPSRTLLYDPTRQSWSVATTSPLQPGTGSGGQVVLSSGSVLVNVSDQWAIWDPNGVATQGASVVGLDSPTLSWWLTVAVLTLGLIVALQFAIARATNWRSSRQSPYAPTRRDR